MERILGSHKPVQAITVADVQQCVNKRARERGNRGKVRPTTLKKELATLRVVWNWGVRLGHVTGATPIKGVKLAKTKEKLPFQTFDEIQRIMNRGGMTLAEQKDLWDCLFLTGAEIAEVLDVVKSNAQHPFRYPMFVFAAHTGARRSEMMRSRVEDFDFEGQTVLIREKKKNKSKETYRHVPMSSLLAQAMSGWVNKHPGGVYMLGLEINQPLRQTFTTKCFRRCLKGSKWVRMRGFHVMRHSFASNLATAGMDQRVIDVFMGHQSVFGGDRQVGKD